VKVNALSVFVTEAIYSPVPVVDIEETTLFAASKT
jgi:hypothetical protein